ncbi:MAG: glycosyltransferase, partial [Bifidobacteriaceae bacterium]|nr:glycosyltransferase [Bifidobacteriaceae bacterium]
MSLERATWRASLKAAACDLLLVESVCLEAWSGELAEVVGWSRDNGVPTALWNTGDPERTDGFIAVAELFDHVFTVDLNSVRRYCHDLGHERVHLLPLAAQPRLHGPIGSAERKRAAVIVEERRGNGERFARDVAAVNAGATRVLPVEAGGPGAAWGKYAVVVGVEEVKSSLSAFGGGVFDALGCATPVVTNYSRGVAALFGELVPQSDGADGIEAALRNVVANREETDKRRAVALRKILSEHTCEHRLRYLASALADEPFEAARRSVAVVAPVEGVADAERVIALARAQEGVAVSVCLVGGGLRGAVERSDVMVLSPEEAGATTLGEAFPGTGAVALFCPGRWYGPHYLAGLAGAFAYSEADVAVKATRYLAPGGDEGARIVDDGLEYRWVGGEAEPARAVFRADRVADVLIADLIAGKLGGGLGRVASVDRFDYCEGPGARGLAGMEFSATLDVGMGMPLAVLTAAADRVGEEFLDTPSPVEIDPVSFPDTIRTEASGARVAVKRTASGAVVYHCAGEASPTVIPLRDAVPIEEMWHSRSRALVTTDIDGCGASGLVIDWLDAAGRRIAGRTYSGAETWD